jgi:hypothetical protein
VVEVEVDEVVVVDSDVVVLDRTVVEVVADEGAAESSPLLVTP